MHEKLNRALSIMSVSATMKIYTCRMQFFNCTHYIFHVNVSQWPTVEGVMAVGWVKMDYCDGLGVCEATLL